MKHVLLVIGLIGFTGLTSAQKELRWWGVELGGYAGKFLNHHPELNMPPLKAAWGNELSLYYQTHGKHAWNQLWNYPSYGVTFSAKHYGNDDVYGMGIGIMPNVRVPVFRRDRFQVHVLAGCGGAFLTKPYHSVTNPQNIFIGSKLNNMSSMRLGVGWVAAPHWEINASVGVTHNSNGGTQLPNLGINTLTGHLGVKWMPYETFPKRSELTRFDELPKPRVKWHALVHAGATMNERGAPGGPKYPIYWAAAEVCRQSGLIVRPGAGFRYEYIANAYAFVNYIEYGNSDAERRKEANRFSAYITNETFLGRMSLSTTVGYYLNNPHYKPKPYYILIGARYHILDPHNRHGQLAIGIYLKTHNGVAEYTSLGITAGF